MMLDAGVVTPSVFVWAFSVVFTSKENVSVRFHVSYRTFNQKIKQDKRPMPQIEDTFEDLAGTKWYFTLDLSSSY